jgi:hypothetical protein
MILPIYRGVDRLFWPSIDDVARIPGVTGEAANGGAA